MDDEQFRQLLDYLHLAWAGYRKVRKGVKKRISRHMQQLGCTSMADYLKLLDRTPEARQQTDLLMTVSISRFFRDLALWQVLETKIVPKLMLKSGNDFRVWSAGCACGEETYSFKIVWETLKSRFERLPELEVWATDINPSSLEKARLGIYPVSSLKEVPAPLRTAHFKAAKGASYAVSGSVKADIVWRLHDLLRDQPPQPEFQIVFLRNNLLTYYQPELKEPALTRVWHSLASGGFLIIGSHEKIREKLPGLLPSPLHPHIFQKSRQPDQKTTDHSL